MAEYFSYTGQYEMARKLLNEITPIEKLAFMTDRQVEIELQKHYHIFSTPKCDQEDFILIPKNKLEASTIRKISR